MQGQLHFQSATNTQAAARQAMANLREKLESEDVRFVIDEPMHLRFRRPVAARRSVLGFVSTCDLECAVEPGGYVIDYHVRIKPVLILLPVILLGSTVIYAITEADLIFAILALVIAGVFAWIYSFAKKGVIDFLQSGVRWGYDDDDDEEEDEDEDYA